MTLRGEMVLGALGVAVAIAVGCTSNDVSPGGVATTSGATPPTGSGSGTTAGASGSSVGGSGPASTATATSGSSGTATDIQTEAQNPDNCPDTQPADGDACMILNDCAYDATGDLCVCTAQLWTCESQQTATDDQPFGGMGMFGGGNNGDPGTGGASSTDGASTSGDTTTDGGAGAPADTQPQCPEAVPTSGDTCPGVLDCPFANDTTCSCRGDGDTWFCG